MATETTREQPSSISTFIWALFFFFAFTILVILGIKAAGKRDSYEDTRAGVRWEKRAERDKADAEQMNAVGWVDEAKGVVRVPIADAKRLVLANLQAKKPAPSSVPLDPRLPKPVNDPAATEPPPMALTSAPQGADTIYFPNLDKPEPPVPPVPVAPQPANPDPQEPDATPGTNPPAAPNPAQPVPAPEASTLPVPAPAPPPPAPADPATAPEAIPPTPAPDAGAERPPLIDQTEKPQPESN